MYHADGTLRFIKAAFEKRIALKLSMIEADSIPGEADSDRTARRKECEQEIAELERRLASVNQMLSKR
jgi:hypothetical protein